MLNYVKLCQNSTILKLLKECSHICGTNEMMDNIVDS